MSEQFRITANGSLSIVKYLFKTKMQEYTKRKPFSDEN